MKLFLSSIRLPNYDEQLKLFGDKLNPSVIIVPNAWDKYPEDRRKTEIASTVSEFNKLGYKPTVLDLVTSSNEQLKAGLDHSDFVWVMGGNSFYLNYCVQKSGFNELLNDALKKGLVYGGGSAGAIIAGPTLHGVEHADDPKEAPTVIWEGLALVKFGVVPHWGMKKYADVLGKMAIDMQPYVTHLYKLNNEQAATVIDNEISIG